jgi:MscS family membrane protein
MREGDTVKLYDFVGTVEQIGLRSTRIRTLDRTIITVPNGELANQRIESFTVRDRLRLATTIGLVYGTTSEQMRAILAALEAILRRHPKIWSESVVVRFKELAPSSLDVEVMAWFQTTDGAEFQQIRQDVLLGFMAAIEANGSAIAFPTRTLHLASPGAAAVVRSAVG